MRPTDQEMRAAIVRMRNEGFSCRRTALLLGVSKTTVADIFNRWRGGDWRVLPRKTGPLAGFGSVIDNAVGAFILLQLHDNPTMYLWEIVAAVRQGFGRQIDVVTVFRFLRQQGFRHKKVTPVAPEQDPFVRALYAIGVAHLRPEQLVFADETGYDNRSYNRNWGWGYVGRPVRARSFFIRGRHYNMIAAMDMNGPVACRLLEGTVNADVFLHFVVFQLLPQMGPFPGE